MKRLLVLCAMAVILCGVICAAPACAQTTGGVMGPVVNAGHRSVQYRLTVDPNTDQGYTQITHRVQYQQAFNDDVLWRIIGQTRETDTSDIDLDYLQAEFVWQVTPNDQAHQAALRLDLRWREGSRPEQIGLNWGNQWTLPNNWQARAAAYTSVQVGDNAARGVALQTRAQLSRKLASGQSVGIEMFNAYGRTGHIRDFDLQNHTVGPFIKMPLTESIGLYSGVLFGITDAAPETQLRLWLSRQF
eukprot:GHVR01066360.1.p2 GENE.GHVR01066360.1~~GHVR01066360.1.p2  ORF type:complete len:245 (-),score=28.58 GHVR01066360.1:2562-3296(-)